MARILKQQEHDLKRSEILDVAQQLIYNKGYEQMTIQDILNALQMSKGAFYHYFASKQTVLEAVIERMQGHIDKLLLALVEDGQMSALEKLNFFFSTLSQWKTEQKPLMLALLNIWYTDDNAIVRQKVRYAMIKNAVPPLNTIIAQGIKETVFNITYPDQTGNVVLSLVLDLTEITGRMLLAEKQSQIENAVKAYTEALERVLGTTFGSLTLVDSQTLNVWKS